MIDTVILTIPKIETVSVLGDGIEPWDLQSRTKGYQKLVKNPSARNKESGAYFPRLSEYTRKDGSFIRIEFSAPKLIYQNNLDELDDQQFRRVVDTLRDRLRMMGLMVPARVIERASVTAVHYSRNIELTGGYTAQYAIGELMRIDLNGRLDLTRTRFMNGGQSLCGYAVSDSFVFYDKIADLARDNKRAIDKDQTPYQRSLFATPDRLREVLRFEVRLSSKQKMNAIFKEIGLSQNPTFKEAFSSERSRAVLIRYWDRMTAGAAVSLFTYLPTSKDLLKQVLVAEKAVKTKKVIYLTGLLWLAREGQGMREVRAFFGKRCDDRTWQRITKDFKSTAKKLSTSCPREWYDQIIASIRNAKPMRLRM